MGTLCQPALQEGELIGLRRLLYLDLFAHRLTLALGAYTIEALDIALTSRSHDEGIDSVVAVILTLRPVFDAKLLGRLALTRYTLRLTHGVVAIEVERMEDIIITPEATKSGSHSTLARRHTADTLLEDGHSLARDVLRQTKLALEEVRGDILLQPA